MLLKISTDEFLRMKKTKNKEEILMFLEKYPELENWNHLLFQKQIMPKWKKILEKD